MLPTEVSVDHPEKQQTKNTLRITEIFYSLQGEANTVGWPTVFIRLTGCPLRCTYCDTTYAFQGGETLDLPTILETVSGYSAKYITVTGGEPLAQKNCLSLLKALCDAGYQVSLETSGALDVSQVDNRVSKVMDLKTPSSGESEKNIYQNIQHLTKQDQIKFVIGDRADYEWAIDKLKEYDLSNRCDVLFSPIHNTHFNPAQLADWILEDKLNIRFQLQLHKYLWGDEPGR
jgi:7-carboxy-7-deazaguanine synthase